MLGGGESLIRDGNVSATGGGVGSGGAQELEAAIVVVVVVEDVELARRRCGYA
jgi:hypothetical protein